MTAVGGGVEPINTNYKELHPHSLGFNEIPTQVVHNKLGRFCVHYRRIFVLVVSVLPGGG